MPALAQTSSGAADAEQDSAHWNSDPWISEAMRTSRQQDGRIDSSIWSEPIRALSPDRVCWDGLNLVLLHIDGASAARGIYRVSRESSYLPPIDSNLVWDEQIDAFHFDALHAPDAAKRCAEGD